MNCFFVIYYVVAFFGTSTGNVCVVVFYVLVCVGFFLNAELSLLSSVKQ